MKPIGLALGLCALFAAIEVRAQSGISGTWEWAGAAGWQRVVLDLKADRKVLSGTMTIGPGGGLIPASGHDWEYFFEPAVFSISNGKIDGNQITFEQQLPVQRSPVIQIPAAVARGLLPVPRTLTYRGTVVGDRIDFVRESSALPNDPFFIGSHRVEFTVARVGSSRAIRSAQPRPAPTFSQARLDVSLDFAAVDFAGNPVTDLAAHDVGIYEDGTARRVDAFTAVDAPWNCLLMFDHNLTWLKNGSPDSADLVANAWTSLLQAASRFLGDLGPNHGSAVASFEDKSLMAVDWANRRLGLNVALPVTEQPMGQKDVYGAVRWALAQFPNATGRRAIVIFTDGRDGRLSPRWFKDSTGREVMDPLFGLADFGEAEAFQQVLSDVRRSGVRLYFIAINTGGDPEFGPAIVGRKISGLYPGANDAIAGYQSQVRFRMEALAEASGARVLYGNTPADAVALFLRLREILGIGKTYTIGFVSPNPIDGAYHSLEVRIPGREIRIAQSRDGYSAR